MAGFGVTGSLLAAVGTIFVVSGGVLAFDHWPGGPGAAPEATLELPVARAATQRAAEAAPVALPAAAVTASAVGAGAGIGVGGVTVAGRKTERGAPTAVAPGTAPAGPTSTPIAPGQPAGGGPAGLLADEVESAAGASARTLRSAGAAAPAAAPATDPVADALDRTGAAVGGLVRGIAGGR